MRSGPLRHLINVDEPITTQSDAGEEVVTFTESFTLHATIEPVTGREALRAGEILAEMDTRITIRWSTVADRITAKWRLRCNNIIYNIKRISHIELRHREIEIMASSGLNEG